MRLRGKQKVTYLGGQKREIFSRISSCTKRSKQQAWVGDSDQPSNREKKCSDF